MSDRAWRLPLGDTPAVAFSRVFAMPNAETFTIKPIAEFVLRYYSQAKVSIDPFARNRGWATHTNDLDPVTSAEYHLDAEKFCRLLLERGVSCDLALFDPPYSPRQISEVYRNIGRTVGMERTQNGALYRRVRDALDGLVRPGGVVLSFGWNSQGMGIGRRYCLEEVLLVAHGGGHNDTICIAERKR